MSRLVPSSTDGGEDEMRNILAVVLLFVVLFLVPAARADSTGDTIIAVSGAFSSQGENFAFSYEADFMNLGPNGDGLVPGTLTFSASGPCELDNFLGIHD
jgi:hypothetical protein